MKQMGKLKRLLILALIMSSLAMPTWSNADILKTGTVTVRGLKGTARYKRGNAEWAPLIVGKNLTEGDTIATGADGALDLFLRQNGPVLRVLSDTTLAFDQLQFIGT